MLMNRSHGFGRGLVAATTVLGLAGSLMAQPDPNRKICTLSWTDFWGNPVSVQWSCPSSQQCCYIYHMSVGSDGQQGTADDCILWVQTGCSFIPCVSEVYDDVPG